MEKAQRERGKEWEGDDEYNAEPAKIDQLVDPSKHEYRRTYLFGLFLSPHTLTTTMYSLGRM
jgi:hypothetical protein